MAQTPARATTKATGVTVVWRNVHRDSLTDCILTIFRKEGNATSFCKASSIRWDDSLEYDFFLHHNKFIILKLKLLLIYSVKKLF